MIEKIKYEYDIKEKSIDFSIGLLKYLDKIEKRMVIVPLIDQLTRSGTSVGANIHEAQSSQSVKEMMRYYRIALKSSNESNHWFLLLNSLTGGNSEVEHLIKELNNLRNILGKTLIKLKEKETRITKK